MHHAEGQIKMGASNDHPVVEFLKKASDAVNSVALVVVTVYISMVTFLVLIGIIYRLLGDSLSWSEELSRWLLSGIAFVGASVVLKRGSHVGVVVFIKNLKSKTWVKYITVITNLLVLVTLIYFFWFGFLAALGALGQVGGIIQVPMVYVKLHLPLGCLFMIVHMLYYIVGAATAKSGVEDYILSRIDEED
jgi:TRAP-type C4-dicarboxylate transport system permease small subunit